MVDIKAAKPCTRCRDATAPYTLRNAPTCRNCYITYVEGKAGRRLGTLARDTKTSAPPIPRKYLAGLSFGSSSTVLTHILDTSAQFYSSRKSSPAFEPVVVHVDMDLSRSDSAAGDNPALRRVASFRERFPNLSFECVHLSKVLDAKTIDWSALPWLDGVADDGDDPARRLQRLLDSLPSATSRTHILRLLIRCLLLHLTLERSCSALLLGHNTTALASLTLSHVANGRGHAVPWQVNDGSFSLCTYDPSGTGESARVDVPVYYPLRQVFRNEIVCYLDMMPSLRDLALPDGAACGSVVSHKGSSLEDIVDKYFDGVEGPYSGIVANVVQTTGKLERPHASAFCPLCGLALDEQGDSRWAGELGDSPDGQEGLKRLCYGCRRTLRG
ncbi:thiouridylase subunit 2 [Ophiocordyceps camponoti-floridani]|uniref:Cytoplasmic tRNA 2-thiolation protein 2 n=1 Tax=Ophiocordyceps camponoti-floridani TaxID=2030778 RepID=A0A8H4VC63_9HYPO|nr:thiouridylase subunit 2 [Ophiocordyceps camponoti-floridani]